MINATDLKNISIEDSSTIPSEWYFNKDIYELEKKAIFDKSWHLIGSQSRIPNCGDTLNTKVLNEPILIVRQKDLSLKAFFNVCQHRGGPLVRKNCTVKSFQCKYHGWIYDIDGSLQKTRDFSGVENFKKQDYGLKSINITSWMGLIFINLSFENVSFPLRNTEIENRVSSIDISNFKYHSRKSYKVECNWKIYIDNYLEGYHIPFVHPRLNKVIDYKSYKTELYEGYSMQWALINPELSPYKKSQKSNNNAAFYFTIFPNILLNIAPGRLQTNIIEPESPNSCIVHFDYYFGNITSENIKKDFDFSEEIQLEDIQICEEVQKGVRSRAYSAGRISKKSEQGLHHFQSYYKKRLSNG